MEHVKFTSARICSEIMHLVYQEIKKNITMSSERKKKHCLYLQCLVARLRAAILKVLCCVLFHCAHRQIARNINGIHDGVCSVWSLMYDASWWYVFNRSKPKRAKKNNKQSLILHLLCESHLFHFHEHAAKSQTHFISPASAHKPRRETRGTNFCKNQSKQSN